MSCLALTPLTPSTPVRNEDDAGLVSAMIDDSEEAWRAFHERHGALIVRTIQNVTRRFWRVATESDAQDVVGVFYLSLVARDKRKLRSFDPQRGYRLASWIRVLATNATYDYLRRTSREPVKEDLAVAEDVPSDALDPFARVSRDEDARAVSRELARFSPRDRTFAKIHLVDGVCAADVASRMNVSIKTVYSKKNKIVCRLEAALASAD